jgi:hypothetical protein
MTRRIAGLRHTGRCMAAALLVWGPAACSGDAGGSGTPSGGTGSAPTGPAAAPSAVEAEVLAAVQGFFDAMTADDPAASRAVLMEDGQYFRVREGPEGVEAARVRNSDYLRRMGTGGDRLLERMWNPTVLVRRDIALVWTPYDFFLNDAFSHCGVDAFSLVRTEEGWKIASIVYTVEREGCEPSPLGPPGPESPPLTSVPAEAREARGPERDEVVEVLQRFARGVEARDSALVASTLHPEGQGYATRKLESGSVGIRRETNEDYLAWLPTAPGRHEELFRDETVLVHGPIAFAWAPYDYRVDGDRVHCGVNAIALFRAADGWISADWVWTVETEGCEGGPAGG